MRGSRTPAGTSGPPEGDVVEVPDAPPAEPRRGLVARLRRRWREVGDRRLARWRAGRRPAADQDARPPAHLALWVGAADRTRIATRRFRELRPAYPTVELLHGRRSPATRAPIDHLLVGPAGVVVVSTRRWRGRVEVRRGRLRVAGRDRTRTVDVTIRQVAAVRDALETEGYAGVPVRGVVHCIETDGVPLDGSLAIDDVRLLDATRTLARAEDEELLTYEAVRRLTAVLERRLPPAG